MTVQSKMHSDEEFEKFAESLKEADGDDWMYGCVTTISLCIQSNLDLGMMWTSLFDVTEIMETIPRSSKQAKGNN